MKKIETIRQALSAGQYDATLSHLYGCTEKQYPVHRARIAAAADAFSQFFGHTEAALFSVSGRTELSGNHTDHQHGCVLAASISLDILAAAAPNGTDIIRIQSEGYPLDEIDLAQLKPVPAERNTAAALIRGVAARCIAMGYPVHGFDAYTTSNVLKGSGLSSSAAFEVMVGNMINTFFADGALTAPQLAQIGQYAENTYFGKPCGLMDQMAASVGGIISIDFADTAQPQISQVQFDFQANGYALCIIDSGGDHADLTDAYAAIPAEMCAIAAQFDKSVLREVEEDAFYANLPALRTACGDRAVLRAMHFFDENKRVAAQVDALRSGDANAFLALLTASGHSSYEYLQNVFDTRNPAIQAVSLTLALCQRLLGGKGGYRVHGGGFAGTVQAFVPLAELPAFKQAIESVLGIGHCHVLAIRSLGGTVLAI